MPGTGVGKISDQRSAISFQRETEEGGESCPWKIERSCNSRADPYLEGEKMGKESYTYTVVYEKVERGSYNVFIPAMRDYRGQAPTLEEARELGKQMVAAALEELARKGEVYPDDLQLKGRKTESESRKDRS